ncbi:MAG: GSCFA domain-containing protein [Vicingaceae bacterium]|nr:GSCFA domain-containing protein [Vicingaceae bacterium]
MIKLFTPVSIKKSGFSISHEGAVFLIGSCFTENIGEKLADNKFDVFTNPTGIIFNPISVVNSLKSVFEQKEFLLEDLRDHNNKWFSFNHHGSFSSFDKEQCLAQINQTNQSAHDHLKKSKTIFITLGSAWIYEYERFGVVANCHKIPNKNFTKRLLSVKEILNAFEQIKADLKDYNVVFTVSPVRHIKDGLHENNLSKATLILAINNLVEQHTNFHYFPAYELVIDELRDYRFYKEDLVHPTDLAVNYVWEKFINCYFDKDTELLVEEIQKIKLAANHKPFNFGSEEHRQFIMKQIGLMNDLSKKHDFLNFKAEVKQISTLK